MLKKIPSVNTLLEKLTNSFPEIRPEYLTQFVKYKIQQLRENPKKYGLDKKDKEAFAEEFSAQLVASFRQLLDGSLKPVINAGGIVLHTNLGRAPLSENIIQKMQQSARYTNLELNLENGRRGQRNDHLSELLRLISGAEDGLAVNNNAAAVMLMLNSLASRKEVILSRGEMVEIGGSFRLPEVMKTSGCKLKEIGTTNKTHLRDYEEAISSKTGAILICHTSNYEIKGFTAKPQLALLVELAHKNNIPVIYDLGSGSLETYSFGAAYPEPQVSEIIRCGVDLVSFSGDKLLGGPQAGLIAGKQKWVQKCAKNHFLRALRLDKLITAALQETLIRHLYRQTELDSLKALNQSADELKERSLRFIKTFTSEIQKQLTVITGSGQVGSGAYPTLEIPSYAIQVVSPKMNASRIARALRLGHPPVLGYIHNDIFYIDLRAVNHKEEKQLAVALTAVFKITN